MLELITHPLIWGPVAAIGLATCAWGALTFTNYLLADRRYDRAHAKMEKLVADNHRERCLNTETGLMPVIPADSGDPVLAPDTDRSVGGHRDNAAARSGSPQPARNQTTPTPEPAVVPNLPLFTHHC